MPRPPKLLSIPPAAPGPYIPVTPVDEAPPDDHVAATVDNDTSTVSFASGPSFAPDPCDRPPRAAADGDDDDVGRAPAAAKRRRVHFNELRVGEVLGRGRFGEVRLATAGGERYALKYIYGGAGDPRTVRAEVARLRSDEREAPCAHLVRTLNAYHSRNYNTMCFLMEYMPLGSLQQCAERLRAAGARFAVGDVAVAARGVLRGLRALRRRHIVHRDVKPANILVSSDGEAKLADFGISRVTNLNSEAGTGCGSYRWMAPERMTPDTTYSYPSDVYSAGLVFCWLLLGTHPIPAESPQELVFAVDDREVYSDGISLPADGGRGGGPGRWGAGTGDADARALCFAATRLRAADRPDAAALLRHRFVTAAPTVPPMLGVLPVRQGAGGAAPSPAARRCPVPAPLQRALSLAPAADTAAADAAPPPGTAVAPAAAAAAAEGAAEATAACSTLHTIAAPTPTPCGGGGAWAEQPRFYTPPATPPPRPASPPARYGAADGVGKEPAPMPPLLLPPGADAAAAGGPPDAAAPRRHTPTPLHLIPTAGLCCVVACAAVVLLTSSGAALPAPAHWGGPEAPRLRGAGGAGAWEPAAAGDGGAALPLLLLARGAALCAAAACALAQAARWLRAADAARQQGRRGQEGGAAAADAAAKSPAPLVGSSSDPAQDAVPLLEDRQKASSSVPPTDDDDLFPIDV